MGDSLSPSSLSWHKLSSYMASRMPPVHWKKKKMLNHLLYETLIVYCHEHRPNFTMLFESSPWLSRWLPISLTTAFPINMASLTFLWLMRTKMSLPLPSLTKTATGQARNSQRPSSFLMARTNPKGEPPPGLGTNLAGQGLISTKLLSRLIATDNILVHIPIAYYYSSALA